MLRLAKALSGRNLTVQQQRAPGRFAAAYSSTELNSDQEISYSKHLSSLSYYQAMALLSLVQTPCQSHHLQDHRNYSYWSDSNMLCRNEIVVQRSYLAFPVAQQTEVEKMEEDICRKELKPVQCPKLKLDWADHQQLTHPIQSLAEPKISQN